MHQHQSHKNVKSINKRSKSIIPQHTKRGRNFLHTRSPKKRVKHPSSSLYPPNRRAFSTTNNNAEVLQHQLTEYEYRTVEDTVEETLLKEKGSKFLGYIFPVSTDEELAESLQYVRSLHPRATHHCYAYRMGPKGESNRANDDGEPSGSAGLPMYNQLLAYNVTDVLSVCVRYYGGTKLGVSGLIKAYKESTKISLDQSTMVIRELSKEYMISFAEFSQQNHIYSLLNKHDAVVLDCVYAESDEELNKIHAKVKLSNEQQVLKLVQDVGLGIEIQAV